MQVNQTLFELLFIIGFILLVFSLGFIVIVGPILSILTPKKLLKTYFKEPHFSQLELEFMSGVSGAFFRMLVFAWTVLRPTKSHVKRNMADCHKLMPKWYFYSLKAFIWISLTPCAIGFVLIILLYAVSMLFGPPVNA